jgi:hypothetical protein
MQATQKANEEQAVIDAPVDEDRVRTFAENLRAAWRRSRTLRAAFSAFGAVEDVAGEMGEGSGSQVKRWLQKALFVSESRIHGLDHVAEEYGRGLAEWEWNALLREAEGAPTALAPDDASVAERLRLAVAELREAGYEPSLVLAPIDWRTFQALELTPAPNRGGDAAIPAWLPDEDGRSSFIGAVEGVPVLDRREVPDDCYVFDLSRFAKLRERDVEDPPGPVVVEITYYDEEKIRELVREDRVRFEDDLDDEAKVRMLQQQVEFNAVYPFEIDVLDVGAARRIDTRGVLPAE